MGTPRPDGTILAYGGDKNPNGIRSFRDLYVSEITEIKKPPADAKDED